jgi:hypothetical protein
MNQEKLNELVRDFNIKAVRWQEKAYEQESGSPEYFKLLAQALCYDDCAKMLEKTISEVFA